MTQLTWEDLEDFGILRLGHQKKMTLAIKRVKDILAGKYVPTPTPRAPSGEMRDLPLSTFQHRTSAPASHYAVPPSVARQYAPVEQRTVYYGQQATYRPDVVAIQVHRNRSSEDVRIQEAPGQHTFYKPGWRQRSYEDGDATPGAETHLQQQNVPGGGTLPRPRGTVKPRPVAKISAKTRSDCADAPEEFKCQQQQYGTLGKKNPPPAPPKRADSGSCLVASPEAEGVESLYGRVKSSPLPPPPPPASASSSAEPMSLLAFSDEPEDFPPPPAPITASDAYRQHGQRASSAAASVRERLDTILQRTGAAHWPARASHYGVPSVASLPK